MAALRLVGLVLHRYHECMRPAILNPLFASASSLPGIGSKMAALYDRLLGRNGQGARVADLLFHLPQGTIDRRNRPKIAEAERDRIVTLEVTVVEHLPPANARSKAPYRVLVEDETGDVQLVFFLANHGWIAKSLPVGSRRWISGKLELWEGHLQMVHPDRILDEEGLTRLPAVEPVYGLTEGLGLRMVQRAVEAALARLPDLPEWLDPAFAAGARPARLRCGACRNSPARVAGRDRARCTSPRAPRL